jgi:hypothetical protein
MSPIRTARKLRHGAAVPTFDDDNPRAEIRLLAISAIRQDGETQHRATLDSNVIAEYAELMKSGVAFPAIRVFWDGVTFWLSDGFQRVAAAERALMTEILAEIRHGSISDAKWDSYSANATHGIRRTAKETERIVQLALAHPTSERLSNVALAKHLHISEATLRRWRTRVSSSHDEDTVRVVTRGKSTYSLRTNNLGKRDAKRGVKSHLELRSELTAMKAKAPPHVRRLLNVIEHWVFGQAPPEHCLEAMRQILQTHD